MNVPYLDLRAAHLELRDELQSAYTRVMDSGRYILGEELERFEHEFAGFCGTSHAIGVGNGLDALTIALRANDIGPGDEVIVPAHTFIATWLAVVECGARLVAVDVDPDSTLMDPAAAAAACTPRTSAIVPVHLYGHPVDTAPFEELARRHGLQVIGDAAQAHGAEVAGRPVGAVGDSATFSFYPSKNLGAVGDGGALTTDDDSFATRARRLRNYGSARKYEFAELGINSRLDPLQAAFLRVKLRVLPDWNARRAGIASRYLQGLAGMPGLVLPSPVGPGAVHAWHTFCVRHPLRDGLRAHLDSCGIQTQVHYAVPPHRTAAFSYLDIKPGTFPVAEATAGTVLSLPIGPQLDEDSVTFVIESVRAFTLANSQASRQ
jgi:dTDP-3-amino-3,4,6-trideoxy-alpha-D-glucose transaminase